MDNILNVHIKNKEGFTIELDGTVTSKDLGVTKIAPREYHIFPIKNDKGIDPFICFYSTIEGVTIFGETKKYNDTLCTYIRNEYLRDQLVQVR